MPPYTYTVSAPCFPRWSLFQSNVCEADRYTGLWRREGRCRLALLTFGLGLFPNYFPGPPLVLHFASSPFHTLCLCFTMGVVLATCQVLGTPAEQERYAYAVPFFPLGSVFLLSEESFLRLDGWHISRKYCLGFGIDHGRTQSSSGWGVGVSNPVQEGKEARPTDQVERLGQANEGEEQETSLFTVILLQLPEIEHHMPMVDRCVWNPHCTSEYPWSDSN